MVEVAVACEEEQVVLHDKGGDPESVGIDRYFHRHNFGST